MTSALRIQMAPAPQHFTSSTLGVIVPVGPSHDPVRSVAASHHAAAASGLDVVHLIVVNGDGATARMADLRPRIATVTDRHVTVVIDSQVGYITAVRHGLQLADQLGLRSDRVGFLDADAELRCPDHWRVASQALDQQPDLDAISGLVVHPQCRVWETLSSAAFVAAMEQATGGPVEKPYLQGGAGGTLARRTPFDRAVNDALRLGTLLGPTLSATSLASHRRVVASSAMPCSHTPRRTMQEWIESVTAYEQSWRNLVDLFGWSIEKPWRGFLEDAERALAGNLKLLTDMRYNAILRQDIVIRVETQRRMLSAAGAR